MAASGRQESWASGDAYEPYVGRWSRLVAPKFLSWLAVPRGRRWLDVGCGTGALSRAILDCSDPGEVLAVDPSEGYLAYARNHIDDGPITFRLGDAQALPLHDGAVDVVVSGLVLNFIPDCRRAMAEMKRIAGIGGIIAAYVWDYAGRMQLMRHFWDAAVALDPNAVALDEGNRFPVCNPDSLTALFRGADLEAVHADAIDIDTVFRDFEDYWSPFLGGQGPAPGYCMSLPEDRRAALRERIRQRLPVRPDGSIHLVARVWAVRGAAA